ERRVETLGRLEDEPLVDQAVLSVLRRIDQHQHMFGSDRADDDFAESALDVFHAREHTSATHQQQTRIGDFHPPLLTKRGDAAQGIPTRGQAPIACSSPAAWGASARPFPSCARKITSTKMPATGTRAISCNQPLCPVSRSLRVPTASRGRRVTRKKIVL